MRRIRGGVTVISLPNPQLTVTPVLRLLASIIENGGQLPERINNNRFVRAID